jgi:hypothetical protein
VVVTSPDKIDECKWELEADTEKFMEAIEVDRQLSPLFFTSSDRDKRK